MVFIKTDRAADALRRLGGKLNVEQLAQAESRAINKTLGRTRTMARTAIKEVYNISQKNLAGVNFQPARPLPGAIYGKLYAGRKPISLSAFSPKEVSNTGSVRITKRGDKKVTVFKRAKSNVTAGVQIEIFKGKKQVIPFAFILPNGAVQVMARGEYKTGTQYGFVQRHQRVTSGSDLPIKPLITVSEFATIINNKVVGRDGRPGPISKFVAAFHPDELVRQIKFLLTTV